ncbi:MAG: short-chain dehydrogenase [Betaproteobacteria bacterium RIFCSPLOWO2_12_FULL_64_23]|nr:MAG: short-chain dehydrogenase [Betaproteobacteria bacterium RIFCSPLOWO2_12_FULL_64_23]
MQSLWDDDEAAQCRGDLELRVYTSRLLGRDKTLVLHGGGNTSVKVVQQNLFGEDESVLYIKGSGWDLETMEAAGFAPVQLDYLLRLTQLDALSDTQMVNQLATHMLTSSAPAPSVETILHACLPHKFVDHTHADAVLAISNTPDGERRMRELYGDAVVIIPYVMPGFDLARLCAREYPRQAGANTIGMVLLRHGLFSFGDSARQSYERMIDLVARAEDYLKRERAWDVPARAVSPARIDMLQQAQLRRTLSVAAGAPMIMATHADAEALAFAQRADLGTLSQQGPVTPDHIIRTKRVPMLGTDAHAYARGYQAYFDEHAPRAKEPKTMLDPAPRVVLDPGFGLAAAGRSAKDAAIVAELYRHSMQVMQRAQALGGYCALPARDLFEVEYWDLEQAKLRKTGTPAPFLGEIALVTGAASGIGRACVDALLARGAAVVGLDINPAVETIYRRRDFLGLRCDLTGEHAIGLALERAVLAYGGLDMLVLNAGIFAASRKISELATEEWRKVMAINLDANLFLLRACHPLLKLAPGGGRVVVIGSKNVPAPGPGAAAYSASKAALNQLARVAALEWGADGIRINSIHPNAVFDTGIWTDEVLAQRAKHYGLTVDEYKTNNVLKTEVRSRDVAELAAEMCGPLFAKTTAAQVPVDGGNERVI